MIDALLAAFFLGLAASPRATPAPCPEAVIVLELFTSQGCSSCPPADELLRIWGAEPGVIALSFHVDYWNDLGWKDPFSDGQWTKRQRSYGATLSGRPGTYTPQLVVNGKTGLVGSHRETAEKLIKEARTVAPAADVAIRLEKSGGETKALVGIKWKAAPSRAADVHLLLVENDLSTPVVRGENGGQTLLNDFVVRRLMRLGGSSVDGELSGILPVRSGAANFRVVVLVQDSKTLEILGAAVAPVSPGK